MIRFAFAGLRHGHIFSLVDEVNQHPETTIVAAGEADASTRAALKNKDTLRITHSDPYQMMNEVECDVIAIGDVYGWRGPLAIRALDLGRHVIIDKPPCTRLSEWEQIVSLSAMRGMEVGCQLSLRSDPALCMARKLIADGAIGEIQTVSFMGQHPLMWGERANWYFQTGLQGGTINDLAIHGYDTVEWIAGRRLVEVLAAHTWNAKTVGCRFFQTGAQAMHKLDNQGGVLSDVSYFSPDRCGYQVPAYWRFSIHGTSGMIERQHGADGLFVATDNDASPRIVACDQPVHGYFEDFLACIAGRTPPGGLDTNTVLRASQLALLTQRAADENIKGLKIPA